MKKKEKVENLEETKIKEEPLEKHCCSGECERHKAKKSNCFITILIVIILVFCIGLGVGAFALKDEQDKCITQEVKDNDKSSTQNKEDSNEIDADKGAYKEILKKIDDLSKIEHLSRNISNVNELTNQELLQFALNYVEINDDDSFSLEEINEIINSYFGRIIDGEDIKCLTLNNSEVVYFFDEDTNKFNKNEEHSGHGGGDGTPYVLNRIVDFTYDGSKYVVEVKKAFSIVPDTGFATNFYRTYKDLKDGKNKLFDVDIIESVDGKLYVYPWQEFEKIADDKLVTYEYVFEYNDDELVLVSYKIGE